MISHAAAQRRNEDLR